MNSKLSSKEYFRFKEFKLRNRDTALKVNTDGVLLAAWAHLPQEGKVLDIGTGGGLIACIVASRSPQLHILGIDISEIAIAEARHNVDINPQFANLSFGLKSYQEMLEDEGRGIFDLIISNPPFFDTNMPSSIAATAAAKHIKSLSPEIILKSAHRLLSEEGSFSLITENRNLQANIQLAKMNNLILSRLCRVRPKPSKPQNRMLMEFRKSPTKKKNCITELVIRNEDNSYHILYKNLTNQLYLNF